MRTGRPRGFCVDQAADRAMNVFWRKGYEGASLSDLTAAMGINAPSLYAAFGSKEGLFRAVLERYDARRKGFMDKVLSAPDAFGVARNYLEGIAEFASDTNGGMNPPGCLLVQSGSCGDACDSRRGRAPSRGKGSQALRALRTRAQGWRSTQERRSRHAGALSLRHGQRHLHARKRRRDGGGTSGYRAHGACILAGAGRTEAQEKIPRCGLILFVRV